MDKYEDFLASLGPKLNVEVNKTLDDIWSVILYN